MNITVYHTLPEAAKEIRRRVFMEEQGFQNEFDETDNISTHLVLFDGDLPVGTCRVYFDKEMNAYILGRLAVIKEYRKRQLGSVLVSEAEKYARAQGGRELALHAQCRASGFYKKCGFEEFGEVGDDEGCPHIWMKKRL